MSMSDMAMIQQAMATAREMESDLTPLPPAPNGHVPETVELCVYKHSQDVSLGLRFMDPALYDNGILQTNDGLTLCIIESVAPNSIAETLLRPGDRVVAVEGRHCSGPADAAGMLRESEGYVYIAVEQDVLPPPGGEGAARKRERILRAVGEQAASLSDDDDEVQSPSVSSKSSSPDGTPRPTGSLSPAHTATASRPARATSGSFHLNLPTDGAAMLAVTGNKGHLRLGKQGSASTLLKASGIPLSPRSRAFRLSGLLSPRSSSA